MDFDNVLDPRLQDIIGQILRKKFPMPQLPMDPLRGFDNPPLNPGGPAITPPWQTRLTTDQLRLSLPAPRGGIFSAYADFDRPMKLRGGGILYKQEF